MTLLNTYCVFSGPFKYNSWMLEKLSLLFSFSSIQLLYFKGPLNKEWVLSNVMTLCERQVCFRIHNPISSVCSRPCNIPSSCVATSDNPQTNGGGELTASYRCTGWVWERTIWNPRLQEEKSAHPFRGICGIYLEFIKKYRRITRRNRSLGSWPIMPKALPHGVAQSVFMLIFPGHCRCSLLAIALLSCDHGPWHYSGRDQCPGSFWA